MKLYKENNFIKLKSKLSLPKKVIKVGSFFILFNLMAFNTVGGDDTLALHEIDTHIPTFSHIETHNEVDRVYAEGIRLKEYRDLINTYSLYYNLDPNKVYELASKLTDSFRTEDYLKTKNIGNSELYDDVLAFDSKELGILIFVRNLYNDSDKYIQEDISKKNSYINELTDEQFIGYISDMLKMDKTLILAVIYHESGRLTSDAFIEKNNPGGLMGSNGLKTFETKEAGIIETILNFYYRFYLNDNNCTIEEIQKVYAPIGVANDPNNLNSHWVDGVTDIKEEIEETPEMFLVAEKSLVKKR